MERHTAAAPRVCQGFLEGPAAGVRPAVVAVFADAGHFPTLFSTLATLEGKIAELDSRIEAHHPVDITAAVGEVREFVHSSVLQVRNLLRGDAATAKTTLAKHLGQLVLNPKQTPTGPVYEVAGASTFWQRRKM